MRPFHTIAIPHKDILEGRLEQDVFAADLYEVSQGRGPEEYKDPDIFFQRTYLTEGLRNLLSMVERRLKGEGGDHIIQIQTPFGGGKTHSLIALYHKAREWKAKPVVIVGTVLGPRDTLWGALERGLTGQNTRLTGYTSPGREAIRELLLSHEPVLILMDEVLEYAVKAAGQRVGDSTLYAQSLAFMQELTEAVKTLDKVCLVITLPSSLLEHYDDNAERFYNQLQKVIGRVEKVYTPVQEGEIAKVIKRRLFSHIDEEEAKKIVQMFVDYAQKENILPAGMEPSEYRDKFLDSYPFMPEVLDVLYHRWGSIHTFQRTRGVLRLLSLVVYSLKDKNIPYISLADFDLSNQELRQELIKHIGNEYNSILDQDITGHSAGAKRVDRSLGNAYQGLKLGTRSARVIFLYSFSSGQSKGATLGEIKRSATTMNNPTSAVVEAVEQLKNNLFYLQATEDRYFFSNIPNLNRILLTKMENVKDEDIEKLESELLRGRLKGEKLKVYIWVENSVNIPDTEDLKLVVLRKDDRSLIDSILKNKGSSPRINRNTLFFLVPMEGERNNFEREARKRIAYQSIEKDKSLNLREEQKKDLKDKLSKTEEVLKELIRKLYRMVLIPSKDGVKELDLGVPTYGDSRGIDEEIYDALKTENEIIERLDPLVIREKYLRDNDFLYTGKLYEAFLRTPGEPRPVDKEVIERSISEGVAKGLFGLGEMLEDGRVECRYFKESASVYFSEREVIVRAELCKKEEEEGEIGCRIPVGSPDVKIDNKPVETIKQPVGSALLEKKAISGLSLSFVIPRGKLSDVMGVLRLLSERFQRIEFELRAVEGEISENEIEERIKEAFNQMKIEVNITPH